MSSLSTKPIIISLAVAAVVVCLGIAAFRMNPTKAAAATSTRPQTKADFLPAQPQTSSPGKACVAAVNPDVPPEALTSLQTRARELADQKRFAEALPEFRNIAAVDPGFPGVNLDLSVSFLQLKHTQDAKAAIDSQLAVSDCLSKLSPEALDAYCKSEMPHATVPACREQLKSIRQTAYFQAALVQMELGRTMNGEPPVNAAQAAPEPVPAPQPRHRVAHALSAPAAAAPHKAAVHRFTRDSGDRALQAGAGTDADLGYSKN